MTQAISPKVVLGVLVACAILMVGIAYYVWKAPTSASASSERPMTQTTSGATESNGKPLSAAVQKGNAAGIGPPTISADQRQQIEEWKRTHPGGYTKY